MESAVYAAGRPARSVCLVGSAGRVVSGAELERARLMPQASGDGRPRPRPRPGAGDAGFFACRWAASGGGRPLTLSRSSSLAGVESRLARCRRSRRSPRQLPAKYRPAQGFILARHPATAGQVIRQRMTS